VRRLQTRLVLAVLGVVVVAFAALLAGFNIVLADRLSHDANEVLAARAEAELATLSTEGGRLTVREPPDAAAVEGEAWVFAGGKLVEEPRTKAAVTAAATRLSTGPRRRIDVSDHDIRLYAVPVEANGQRLGTVVAGLSLVPYEHTKRVALVVSLITLGALLALVGLLARWIVSLALRPVARMTAQAADWSEHDLDRRFSPGEPHDELTRLAATLDNLLGRVAASLRREQRFSSEISHELRTPLAKVRAEAELALRHPRSDESYRQTLARVLSAADQMEQIVDTLLAVAREEGSSRRGTSDAREAAAQAAESCADLAASQGIDLEVSGDGVPARVATDQDLVERILVPVIENACRYGRSHVTLTTETSDSQVVYTVTDDGPGVAAGLAERIFEPGYRGAGAAANGAAGGAGLGLALSRRLARAARGEVQAHPDERGGRFTVSLPTS
jgi:two-component system, OmpR family, sensor kinase